MTFQYVCHPVSNMESALRFYQDVLGWKEKWRVGDTTVGLQIQGSDIELVLDKKENNLPAGAQLVLDSVDSFYIQHKEQVKFVWEPMDIPPGRLAAFEDPSGNTIRIMDFSKVQA